MSNYTMQEKILLDIWSRLLRIEDIQLFDNFVALGGDSLLSIHMVAQANMAGLSITIEDALQAETLQQLASFHKEDNINNDQESVTGIIPLIPTLHWFLNELTPRPLRSWVIQMMFTVPATINEKSLQHALLAVINHHDSLRSGFRCEDDRWKNYITNTLDKFPLQRMKIRAVTEQDICKEIELKANTIVETMKWWKELLIKCVLFEVENRDSWYFLIVIDHLVCDGFSLQILKSDLNMAYLQSAQGEEIILPPKTMSIKKYAEHLMMHVKSKEFQEEITYWCSQPWDDVKYLPIDFPEGRIHNTYDSVSSISISLSSDQTKALIKFYAMTNIPIDTIILAAISEALLKWVGPSVQLINVLRHGREAVFQGIDLSRTLGWLAYGAETLLRISRASNVFEILEDIRGQLSMMPKQGFGLQLLRYLEDSDEVTDLRKSIRVPEITLNYHGQVNTGSGSLYFQRAPKSMLSTINREDPKQVRHMLLLFEAVIFDGQLEINLAYSSKVHHTNTMERLCNNISTFFYQLIAS